MKTVAITGSTSGIGLAGARQLDALGYRQIWLVRDTQKAEKILEAQPFRNPVEIIPCDLADLSSVKTAAETLNASDKKIDALLNNAGGMFFEKQLSRDGYELTFAMNHLGHFLLGTLLIDRLLENKARVVCVSSDVHRMAKIDPDSIAFAPSFSSLGAYAQAKLCNLYFVKELHRRYADRGLTTYALHPGVVRTGFGSSTSGFWAFGMSLVKPFMISPDKGAATSVYLVTEPGIESLSGSYFEKRKPVRPAAAASDEAMARRIWDLSEELVKPFR